MVYTSETQRKAKNKRGREPSTHPGPATLKHIEQVYRGLKTNYPHGIFTQIAREFAPNSRAKHNRPQVTVYFANPEDYSIDCWHRIFKAIAVVKARY